MFSQLFIEASRQGLRIPVFPPTQEPVLFLTPTASKLLPSTNKIFPVAFFWHSLPADFGSAPHFDSMSKFAENPPFEKAPSFFFLWDYYNLLPAPTTPSLTLATNGAPP